MAEIIKKVAIIRGLIEDPHPFHSPQEHADEETGELVADLAATKREGRK